MGCVGESALLRVALLVCLAKSAVNAVEDGTALESNTTAPTAVASDE
eukprot:SAG31_NODE_34139_length_336_cov_0.654008_1_plen_46_part_01